MDQDSRTFLAMFDRVARIEPQLRVTLAAARQTAQDAVADCFRNYSWKKTDVNLHDDADYESWVEALKEKTRYDEKLATIIAGLAQTAAAMKANGAAIAATQRAATEAMIVYLSGLEADPALKAQVDEYVAYTRSLLEWAETRSSGNWAAPPQALDSEVHDAMAPLIANDKTDASHACRVKFTALQTEQGQLYGQFETKRDELKNVMAQMDAVASKMDSANLEAAKAIKKKLNPMARQDRRMRAIGRSAVDTCQAVMKLALRVAVVASHPPTLGDTE